MLDQLIFMPDLAGNSTTAPEARNFFHVTFTLVAELTVGKVTLSIADSDSLMMYESVAGTPAKRSTL
jgi:hypothetical protein